jgi:hypothetical protein
MPKVRFAVTAYTILSDAIESSLGFCFNRIEHCCDIEITDAQRLELTPRMLNEIMIAVSDVVDFERSGVAAPQRKPKSKPKLK